MRKLHIVLGLASLATGPLLHAQERVKVDAKGTGESCVTTGGNVECRIIRTSANRDSVLRKRAALGLHLQPTGTRRDTLGVFVGRVTPGGPAENAGVVEGDRIASIHGVDLRVAPADVEDHYTAGLPAHRLTREVNKLTPGSRVTLRVYSGGRYREVQVTAASQFDLRKSEGFGFHFGPEGGMMHMGPGASGMMLRSAPRVRIFRDGPGEPRMRSPERMRLLPRGGELELDEEFKDIELKPSKKPAGAKGDAKMESSSGASQRTTIAM